MKKMDDGALDEAQLASLLKESLSVSVPPLEAGVAGAAAERAARNRAKVSEAGRPLTAVVFGAVALSIYIIFHAHAPDGVLRSLVLAIPAANAIFAPAAALAIVLGRRGKKANAYNS